MRGARGDGDGSAAQSTGCVLWAAAASRTQGTPPSPRSSQGPGDWLPPPGAGLPGVFAGSRPTALCVWGGGTCQPPEGRQGKLVGCQGSTAPRVTAVRWLSRGREAGPSQVRAALGGRTGPHPAPALRLGVPGSGSPPAGDQQGGRLLPAALSLLSPPGPSAGDAPCEGRGRRTRSPSRGQQEACRLLGRRGDGRPRGRRPPGKCGRRRPL